MPINKATDKSAAAAEPKGGFYAAVRRVQTSRSAATISNGCNIIFGSDGKRRETLFSKTTRVPVKGSITIPYGAFGDADVTDKCGTVEDSADPMAERSLLVRNYSAFVPICTDATDDAPELEDFYKNALRYGLERTIDKNIIYTDGTNANGLIGIIGPSVVGASTAAARGSVAINNATDGEVALTDVQVLISAIDPYSYSVEDLVILLNPETWQSFITLVSADGIGYGRIDQAKRTLDGFQVFVSPAVPAGQAGVAAIGNYLIGLRKELEVTTCADVKCENKLRAKARMAGAMAGIGGGSVLNATKNTGTIALGAPGVFAAFLTGVAGAA